MKMMNMLLAALALTAATSCDVKKPEQQAQAVVEEVAVQDSVVAVEGKEAPDFKLLNPEDKELTLSQFRGKVVVLDFWGSWCGWCIKGMPALKEFYEQHPGQFEIIGIDWGDPKEKWVQTIERLGLTWQHVRATEKDKALLQRYNIEGFPTKIIIDAEGKIYHITVGEDPSFFGYLEEALK